MRAKLRHMIDLAVTATLLTCSGFGTANIDNRLAPVPNNN
jgi:hypothetical protein